MEAKTTGVFCNMPETMTKRPLESNIVFVGSNRTLLWMMMAAPLAFSDNLEWNKWPIHALLIRKLFDVLRWVSWRNIMSPIRCCRCVKTLPILVTLFMPLVFHEIRRTPLSVVIPALLIRDDGDGALIWHCVAAYIQRRERRREKRSSTERKQNKNKKENKGRKHKTQPNTSYHIDRTTENTEKWRTY